MSPKEAAYINKRKSVTHTFVVSQPRCGSTLLMRLYALSGYGGVMGDRSLGFYEAIQNLWRVTDHDAIYGSMTDIEKARIFADTYAGFDYIQEMNLRAYFLKNMLFCSDKPSKLSKSTILGFGNTFLTEFVQTLRELFDQSPPSKLQIVFLTRDHDEIIESMATKIGPGQQLAKDEPEVYKKLLDDQLEQMNDAYELGDTWIDYKALVSEPLEILLKMNPPSYPNEKILREVMAKKLR